MRAVKSIVTIILLFTTSIKSNGQLTARKTFPVIRHNTNSSLPDSIHVVGYLADAPASGMCGGYCMGGTIKIKLKDKILGYNNEFVYLVTACLGDNITPGKLFDVTATKLRETESECYYVSIMNPFNSNGFPYYKLSEQETSKIH